MSAQVVPRAGTWIETVVKVNGTVYSGVVPRAGTWIETKDRNFSNARLTSRSPCGNVD